MKSRIAPLLIVALGLAGCAETGLSCGPGTVEDDRGECVPDPVDSGVKLDSGPDGGPPDGGVCEPECDEGQHCVQTQPGTFECVECRNGADCASGICNDENECVECAGHSDCTDTAEAQCNDAGECVPCESQAHCAARGDENALCSEGVCVECTAGDTSRCGGNPCRPDGTCSEHPSGQVACLPCDTDANCADGLLCVAMTFGSTAEPVGSFCLWKRSATGVGAPNGTCGVVSVGVYPSRPFASTLAEHESVDGEIADICSLRTTTCPALLGHATPVEGCEAAGDDAACGVEGLDDGRCRLNTSGVALCTYPCLGTEDCQVGSMCPVAGDRVCSI